MNYPIVNVELQLENMKVQLSQFLRAHSEQLNNDIEAMIAEKLTSESVSAYLEDKIEACIKELLDDEINAFFMYGEGKKALHKTCKEKLNEMFVENE